MKFQLDNLITEYESLEAELSNPAIYSDLKRLKTTNQKKKSLENIKEGDILSGVVRNVVAFGAFVDIWLKNDGLVHVSQIADKFISNPLEYLSVWQEVKTRIVKIDPDTGKIQLSLRWI